MREMPSIEPLLQASANVAVECPRELGGSMHIVDYQHRESGDRIICLEAGAPFESKEVYPNISKAQHELWEAHHQWANQWLGRKKTKHA